MATRSTPKKLDSLNALFAEAALLRKNIADTEAELAPLKEDLKETEQRILNALLDSGTEAHKTELGSYTIRRSTVPKVVDWKLVDQFILKTKSLDLLHRRLTATAWAERVENGIVVPGVESTLLTNIAWRGAK